MLAEATPPPSKGNQQAKEHMGGLGDAVTSAPIKLRRMKGGDGSVVKGNPRDRRATSKSSSQRLCNGAALMIHV